MRIKIQPAERPDMTLPYPYFIESGGYVGRQDFWEGNPYKLLGFNDTSKVGDIKLSFEEFWKKPEKAIGMYPVFSTAQDEWWTYKDAIESITRLKN